MRRAGFVVVLMLVLLFAGSRTASAAPLTLKATALFAGLTDFTVTFDDTGDGLLQFAEITSFSGFSAEPPATAVSTWTSILSVPSISGFATTNCTASTVPSCSGGFLWLFSNSSGAVLQAGSTRWSYGFVQTAPPTVPEPGTILLVGMGAALALIGRRRAGRRAA